MSNTAWLNDEETRAWLAYIDLSTLLGDYLDRQLRRDAEMSHTTYHLLSLLAAQQDRSARMTDLAQHMKITVSRLSHAVAKLEEAGWVRRGENPADKRGRVAILTDRGFEALSAAAPGHVEAVRKVVFDHLSPEQVQQFAEIAGTLVRALVAQDEDAAAQPADLPWRRR
jgi:DNA-binding MarR family transcriptional regulator